MRLTSRVFLLIAVLTLSAVCVRCDGSPKSDESKPSDIQISREQAILIVENISDSSAIESTKAYPDMDREIGDTLYYYIRVIYESGMSAAYFVDAVQGNAFVAVGGELDVEHPTTIAYAEETAPDVSNGRYQEATKTAAVVTSESSVVGKLVEAVGMTEAQIRETFGKNYKDFSVSYDGYMKAYYYMEEGFIVAFGNDSKAKYIYCTDKIDVNGAKAGMNFAEIQALLGSSPSFAKHGRKPRKIRCTRSDIVWKRCALFSSRANPMGATQSCASGKQQAIHFGNCTFATRFRSATEGGNDDRS